MKLYSKCQINFKIKFQNKSRKPKELKKNLKAIYSPLLPVGELIFLGLALMS